MNIYIEGDSIVVPKMSGIGHATLELIRSIDEYDGTSDNQYYVIIPSGKINYFNSYNFKNIKAKKFPKGYRYINYILTRISIPVPADLYFGKGLYIFPNYKNWWTPFSKSITYIHDAAFVLYPETVHPKNLAYLRQGVPRWIKRTQAVVTVSESSSIELQSAYPGLVNKIHVIYNGVNTDDYYKRSANDVANAKSKYNLPDDYFLYVGNLEPRKNILNMLAAYKLYCDHVKNPRPLLLVSGGGWNSENIIETITSMQGNGYRVIQTKEYVADKDLPAVYSGAYALIHVAIHEGFGIPPLQAIHCSVPVIVSDIPVIHEVLSLSSAVYVNPLNPNDIAQAMWSPLSVAGEHEINRLEYSWKKSALQLIELADRI